MKYIEIYNTNKRNYLADMGIYADIEYRDCGLYHNSKRLKEALEYYYIKHSIFHSRL